MTSCPLAFAHQHLQRDPRTIEDHGRSPRLVGVQRRKNHRPDHGHQDFTLVVINPLYLLEGLLDDVSGGNTILDGWILLDSRADGIMGLLLLAHDIGPCLGQI